MSARRPAVLFDLGNVLVRVNFARAVKRLQHLAPHVKVEQALLFDTSLARRFGLGELAPREFFSHLAADLGVSLHPEELAALWCDIFEPMPEMEALAAEVLAAGCRVYLASNTDPVHFAYERARIPVLERLTGLHLSYEVGLLKPDPAFFTSALSRFALSANDCIFLDDVAVNVAAAEQCGIRGQVFLGDATQARAFLRQAGVPL